MNQYLKTIQDLLQQNKNLNEADKEALLKSIVDAEKQWSITDFKLERTEKVKKTTAILLEETIEELEQKRKAVEAQNRELEIESSLEKVRTVAMGMRQRDDMLDICRTMSEQLESLGIKEIRNVQTAIFYKDKGTYINYEYYRLYDKALVTEVDYTNDEISVEFAAQMIKGADEVFIRSLEGQQVKDWLNFQKTTNVFIDTNLEKATSLTYYWFSLGPVAIGTSTYDPLGEEEIILFKRFRNVFDLAYRRYLDIEKAEAQAYEAKIEASLERVRAVAMSLRKSEDLIAVCEEMYKELALLGFANIRNAQIAIKHDEKQAYVICEYSDYAVNILQEAPYNSSAIVQELYNELGKTGDALYQKEFSGKEFEDWRTWRKSIKDSIDIRIDEAVSMCFYLFSMGTGHVGISTFNAISNEQVEILKRFKNVFELSYRRYTDVAKAEAQAREAQIELALERVRARTMAMQKSEELAETSLVLFQQFKDLGETSEQISIGIFKEDENIMELYSTLYGSQWKEAAKVDLDEPVVMKKIHTAWREQKKSLVIDIAGKDLRKYNAYRKKLSNLEYREDRWVIHIAFFSKGVLTFSTTKPHPPETIQLLERFAGVFDQTYTRFLDLQKAEAQAKEAKIEAALERVRARSMAMHHSSELHEVADVLFQQLRVFGGNIMNAGIALCTKDSDEDEYWLSSDSGLRPVISIPHTEDPIQKKLYEDWKNKSEFYSVAKGGDELKAHYNYMSSVPSLKPFFEEGPGWSFPAWQKWHAAYFSHGYLFMITLEPYEEEKILVRFARVFEQAYTRFLDLQKSEAQAREAQIEAALEKVRSRSLAMHKSDELNDVVTVLFERLKELQIPVTAVGIHIYIEGSKDLNVYVCGDIGNGLAINNYLLPYFNHPIANDLYDVREKRSDFFVGNYSPEEKNSFYKYVFEHSALRHLPDDIKNMILQSQSYSITMAPVKNSMISVNDFEGKHLSENEEDVLKRFAKVFEQAYIRFLDLQKAEAQVREAKIEAALERTRTQSMIMQHSKELDDVLRVFHEQVLLLGIHSAFSFLWLPDEEKDRHIFWAAWGEDKNGSTVFKSKAINYPLDRNEPATAQCLVDWKGTEPIVSYHVAPAGVENYFAAWQELIDGVEKLKPEYFSGGLYYVEAFMKYGCFGVMVVTDLTEDEKKILGRFAIEFERTYTRFLDLQKAEAQAREAQIEAALERVRSRTMGMQKSEELKEVIQVVYEQFVHLNILIEHTGFIMDYKARDDMHIWLADRHEVPSQVTIPYFDCAHWNSFNEAKKNGKNFFANNLSFEEKNRFYQDLFKLIPGLPEEAKEYYFSCPGLAISTVLLENVGLYIENFSGIPYSDEENNTLMRFGKVFQQTYTRFLDLQKSEAQAREAQIETGLERVRSRTLAMHKSDELGETAAVLFRQLTLLGIAPNRLYIGIIKDDIGHIEFWVTDEDGSKVSTQFTGDANRNASIKKIYDAWKKEKKSLTIDMQGKELENYFHYLADELNVPFKQGLSQKRRIQNVAFFGKGFIGIASPDDQPEETTLLLERFAAVFNLTYTRFNDLQNAEAQTHKARIETALERVRARALAMQQPEELKDVAEVLRHEMGLLGVEELETCSIYINDVQAEKAECWYALKDIRSAEKKLVSDHFALNLNDTWVGREMLQFYNSPAKQTSIVMQGANRKEWINYCEKNSPLLRGYYGDVIPDRTYHLYKFSHGAVGAASAGDISNESWDLLQRTASVFSLAYSRFKDLTQARTDLIRLKEEKKRAEDALTELQVTQKQLIQSEKMASLGELTAGIAHEIQNPLNFVNNFSDVSSELLDEMKTELEKGNKEDAMAIVDDVKQNLEKILHHGKRADAIVKGMLQHSRSSSGQKEPTDINALCDEYLRLAFHGLRAKDKSFNAKFETDFDNRIGKINIIPQDIGRVLVNLINNAFYAVTEKKKLNSAGYEPSVTVKTLKNPPPAGGGKGAEVVIRIKDNGTGIPQKVLDKIFQPFFTTKPTGLGTGLGLSLSYDIITKGHSGELKVETKEGEGSEFIIQIPMA